MAQKKLFSKLTARQIIWTISIGFLLGTIFLLYQHKAYFTFLIAPMVILLIVLTDSFQTKHSVRKNYPLIGRLRYIFESFRPEFRQYFFEGELDGKPFNRRQRSIVYQRAKNEKQTISFGMQDDPNRVGYEWAAHSVYPKKANIEQFRTLIGKCLCSKFP